MTLDRLLAKSWDGDPYAESVTLPGHLRDVHAAALAVFNTSADDQLMALGLDPGFWRDRMKRIVLFAAALHDFGKANDRFQEMIRGNRRQPQGLRHEWVTYLMLAQPGWREWSQQGFPDPRDWHITLWCITGHHPGHRRLSPPEPVEGAGCALAVILEHPDAQEGLKWVSDVLTLPDPPTGLDLNFSLVESLPENAFGELRRCMRNEQRIWQGLADEDRRLVAACKAFLIAADVAGSALPRKERDLVIRKDWVVTALSTRPDPADISGLVEERLQGQLLRPFQESVASSTGRVTLVRAGCGTGKTVAAYLWAARQWPGRRLYFCYPTTGTATEGYRGYLFSEHDGRSKYGAALFHSRADVDIELILGVAADSDEHDEQLRIQALEAWGTPIAACTADTVLGLVQNHRRGLFAWPALAASAFVFDEIHAYDAQLFGALLRVVAGGQEVRESGGVVAA